MREGERKKRCCWNDYEQRKEGFDMGGEKKRKSEKKG